MGKSLGHEKRVVVIGASSGIGRCVGLGLARRGARTVFMARRKDRLEAAAAEAGRDALAIACDVTDEESCRNAIGEAAEQLGGIDGLVYSSGAIHFAPLRETDAATWARVLATNVTGAALVTAAALPHLEESQGTAVYLSSISASLTPPWPMLGAYVTSKAALDKLVEAWRAEHPDIGFTRFSVGDCAGGEGDSSTEFASGADPGVLGPAMQDWLRRGYMSGQLIDVEDLVGVVDAILSCGPSAALTSVTIAPRGHRATTPASD